MFLGQLRGELNGHIFFPWRAHEIYPRDVSSIGVLFAERSAQSRDAEDTVKPVKYIIREGRLHPLISRFSPEANAGYARAS